MSRHLHIICLDVPYPVDYGGVFDLFYKLPSLQKLGVHIHLHCFEYGRGEQKELEKYCLSVQYYKREKKLSFRLPYIVSSRSNEQLMSCLLKDNHPILMEGIHCTYPLTDKRFQRQKNVCTASQYRIYLLQPFVQTRNFAVYKTVLLDRK